MVQKSFPEGRPKIILSRDSVLFEQKEFNEELNSKMKKMQLFNVSRKHLKLAK